MASGTGVARSAPGTGVPSLSHALSATVIGPAGVSVVDGEAEENVERVDRLHGDPGPGGVGAQLERHALRSGVFFRVTAYTLRATTDAEADGGGDELHTLAVSFTVAVGETSTGTVLKLRHIPELEFLWLASNRRWSLFCLHSQAGTTTGPDRRARRGPIVRAGPRRMLRTRRNRCSGPHLFQDGRQGTGQTDHQPREK